MEINEYSIQELCDQTGLPRRTIHFYIQQGILPPPSGSGLGARYSAGHLVRLKLIPLLRQQGLKLDDIRRKFHSNDPAGLEQLLAQFAPAAPTLIAAPKEAAPMTIRENSGFAGQSYQAFHLAHGIIVLAPQDLPSEVQARLDNLLRASELDQ